MQDVYIILKQHTSLLVKV